MFEIASGVLVVVVLFLVRKHTNAKLEAAKNMQNWTKWEQEYWYLRSFDQNKKVKLSWSTAGRIDQEEYDKLQEK